MCDPFTMLMIQQKQLNLPNLFWSVAETHSTCYTPFKNLVL